METWRWKGRKMAGDIRLATSTHVTGETPSSSQQVGAAAVICSTLAAVRTLGVGQLLLEVAADVGKQDLRLHRAAHAQRGEVGGREGLQRNPVDAGTA